MFTSFKNYISHIPLKLKQLQNSFSTKLTTIFLIALIVPLLIVSIIFYKISSDTYGERLIQATQLTSRQLAQQIDERFMQLTRIASTLEDYMLNFPNSLYGLAYNNSPNLTEQLDAFSTLRTNVYSLQSSFALKNISIFLNDNSFFSNEGLTFFRLSELEDFKITENYLELSNDELIWLYVPEQQYPFVLSKTYEPTRAILCMYAQITQSEQVLNYAYFISIDAAEFDELISTAYTHTDVNGYLIDENGMVICSSETADSPYYRQSFSQEELELLKENNEYETSDTLYLRNRISNGWSYITEISYSYIHSNTFKYFRTLFIILAFVLPIACFTVIILSKSVTKRIRMLSNSARKVNFKENQLHIKSIEYIKDKPQDHFDEIDILAATYNRMIDTIQNNIDHITELRMQQETLKYQLLQSLINPHFLYNILDSIATCNRIGNPDLANKMIYNLTRFYRMTLRKSDELITIKDELEITRLYMELESICRGGNFSWDIELDDEIDNFLICKFTLQPFVENSILHGMQGFNRHLHIHIKIEYGEDTICIYIIDDGHGISPEKLTELRAALASGQINTEKHFGICNVSARISSSRFGHGTIEIDSEPDNGTCVKLEFQQILP